MKFSISIALTILAATAPLAFGASVAPAPGISGDYLEVRSCDVYTGSCFANSEMNLAGREGMLFWNVREGAWNGTKLDGLGVMAVVRVDGTLGDLKYQPRTGDAVLLVDARADAKQRDALESFARTMSGGLIGKVVDVKSVPIEANLATCSKLGCASVKAGELVEISTSCLGGKHDVCGNEETFYPPLSKVEGAYPVFTDVASFKGKGLNCTWQMAGKRNAFLATFTTTSASGHGADVALAR
jgi:hypothetical protein